MRQRKLPPIPEEGQEEERGTGTRVKVLGEGKGQRTKVQVLGTGLR
jgi:hypothetical protein